MAIENDAQLYSTTSLIINEAMEYVMQKMYDMYKDLIDEIVYNTEYPVLYDRTYEFAESWQKDVQQNGMGAQGTITQDYSLMSFDPDTYTHGSEYYSPEDVRPFLANIIYEGLTGKLFGDGWWRNARDAWTPLINKLESGQLDKWFRQGMDLAGGLRLQKV
jgi:hypothetical protein